MSQGGARVGIDEGRRGQTDGARPAGVTLFLNEVGATEL